MSSPTTDRRLGLAGGAAWKAPVTALATGNILLSAEQTVDGVAVKAVNAAGIPDRVLCIGQTNPVDNGIWDVSTGAWTRSIDSNGNYDFSKGTSVLVTDGSTYTGSYWQLTAANPITIGTRLLTWARALPGSITAAELASTADFTKGVTLIGGAARVVDSIAVLRTLPKTGSPRVLVTGYYAAGDGGGGSYYYDSTDTTTADDGGSVIVASDGGRWKLNSYGVLSIKQFGAVGSGAADDTTSIRNAFAAWAKLCIASGSAKITAPAGKYKITAIIDVSTYFTAASYYNLQVDFDQGCVFQIASALLPAFRFGAPDGGSFAFGKFNLGSFNGNGFATTCLYLANIVDSDIRVGSVGGYTGGVGVNCKTTGAAGGLLNNDIYIAALLGGAYGLLTQDAAVTAHAFQGNRVKIGHCTSHTSYGVNLQSLSSSNTIDIASLEANTNGILDQAGYNIFRLNFANGNSVNMGSANGQIDVEGYQFTMVNSANGVGRVKDNAVSTAPLKPAVPASNANYQNTFQRPATMTVSGGTMNFIAIQGVNLLQTSGSFRVPYGAIVVLNYSVAPTWVWTFE